MLVCRVRCLIRIPSRTTSTTINKLMKNVFFFLFLHILPFTQTNCNFHYLFAGFLSTEYHANTDTISSSQLSALFFFHSLHLIGCGCLAADNVLSTLYGFRACSVRRFVNTRTNRFQFAFSIYSDEMFAPAIYFFRVTVLRQMFHAISIQVRCK